MMPLGSQQARKICSILIFFVLLCGLQPVTAYSDFTSPPEHETPAGVQVPDHLEVTLAQLAQNTDPSRSL